MKKNIIANLAGRFWSILSNFLFIPLYIKYLGFESYSVISFTLLIAGIMAILDSGLTSTLSREFARKDKSNEEKFRIFKTLESGYLIIVLLCISLIFIFSGFIAHRWINVKSFSSDQISYFLKIISFEVGFQLLFRFYAGGLLGLDKQVVANIYQIGWGIFRNGLVIFAIIFFPDLKIFFLWQAVSTIIFTVLTKISLQRKISDKNPLAIDFKIEKDVIRNVGKFAGGMLLISVVASFNTQVDKVIISKLLSIDNLGYYTIAIAVSQVVVVVIGPIITSTLPLFTAHASEKNAGAVSNLYDETNLIISIMVSIIFALLMFYPHEIILLWTHNPTIAEKTKSLLPIVSLSYAMLALQMLPFNIAIAHGYTKANNILGIASIFVTGPAYFIFANRYGLIGTAMTFCVVQVVTTLIYIYFINHKFMNFGFLTMLLKRIIQPFVVSIIFGIIFKAGFSLLNLNGLGWTIFQIAICGICLSAIHFALYSKPIKHFIKH